MVKIKPEQYFYANDGRVIKSIEELPKALSFMQNGAFRFHANETKNDFAEWVFHVFKKKRLANQLRNASSKSEAMDILRQELKPKPRKTERFPQKPGYFSELESLIMKNKVPKDVLAEMKKYWDSQV